MGIGEIKERLRTSKKAKTGNDKVRGMVIKGE